MGVAVGRASELQGGGRRRQRRRSSASKLGLHLLSALGAAPSLPSSRPPKCHGRGWAAQQAARGQLTWRTVRSGAAVGPRRDQATRWIDAQPSSSNLGRDARWPRKSLLGRPARTAHCLAPTRARLAHRAQFSAPASLPAGAGPSQLTSSGPAPTTKAAAAYGASSRRPGERAHLQVGHDPAQIGGAASASPSPTPRRPSRLTPPPSLLPVAPAAQGAAQGGGG